MAPKYKLTYFSIMGPAEPIRFLLAYGNQEFEDYRVQKEQWPSMKSSMPFGQVPILEVDGKRIHQSVAICRYLGKQFGLNGSNAWEDLEIDAMVDTITDFRQRKLRTLTMMVLVVEGIGSKTLFTPADAYEKDEQLKEKIKDQVLGTTLPYYMEKFEEHVKRNNGFLAAGKMTWADLYFIGIHYLLNYLVGHNLFDKYPSLDALRVKVENVPQIKAWLDKRPKTVC